MKILIFFLKSFHIGLVIWCLTFSTYPDLSSKLGSRKDVYPFDVLDLNLSSKRLH